MDKIHRAAVRPPLMDFDVKRETREAARRNERTDSQSRRRIRTLALWTGALLAALGVVCVGIAVHLRVLAASPEPVFVIERDLEIAASPQAVWRVLTDFEAYPDWNPYVLAVDGDATPGETIAITILQENWPKPLTVHPRIVTVNPPRELRWHGSPLMTGFLETDHYFQLEELGPNRTRLHHAEEFRGWLARRMDDEEHHAPTRNAFQAMNDALANRVTGGP